jgi:hypothetical protein
MKKSLSFAVFLLIVSAVFAQDPTERGEPARFLMDAVAQEFQGDILLKRGDGMLKCDHSDDNKAYETKSAGVVIFSPNTGGCVDGALCTKLEDSFEYAPGFEVLSYVPQSVIFKPSSKRSEFLEIIWSGQINISSATDKVVGLYNQQVYLRCTVTQKGESVPCSGTCWDPSVAQDVTGDGLTEWVTYHGYVEMDPKREVTVEIQLFATVDTEASVCEDTLILKY